jgi:hypothetical protein
MNRFEGVLDWPGAVSVRVEVEFAIMRLNFTAIHLFSVSP